MTPALLSLRTLLTGLCLSLAGTAQPVFMRGTEPAPHWSTPAATPDLYSTVEEHLAAGRNAEAAELLKPYLASAEGDVRALGLMARALAPLGRSDEGAHYADLALRLLEDQQQAESKDYKDLRKLLFELDPLAKRRVGLFNKIGSLLLESSQKLLDSGHIERALQLLERLRPIVDPAERSKLDVLLEQARAAFEEIDLDEVGSDGPDARRPALTVEGKHYIVIANIELDVAQLVADTMDDIYENYVSLYLDGDHSKTNPNKLTIRIHPTWESMTAEWPGQPPTGLGGWFNGGENQVVCYDTRTRTNSLDEMLGTLFHEASHQFMFLLTSRGGWSPAWLNEGTASFFEGARAMADHRVLWPDAADGRLRTLYYFLTQDRPPTFNDLISWNSPASYPGEFYAFGWGLVYFLQEYEDTKSLQYVWREKYGEYRERITTTKVEDSKKLFEEVFLGPDSPGGVHTVEDFAKLWEDWIVEQVWPLHSGNAQRELRRQRADKYLAAAAAAKGRKTEVGEAELLSRALRDVEYIRRDLDGEENPDGEILLMQAGILGRLERTAAEAALIEQALGLVDDGLFTMSEERYSSLDERLSKIDRKNYPLREARARIKSLTKDARRLLADYEASTEPALVLRSYTFAASAGDVLEDSLELLPAGDRLRLAASEAGLLLGSVRSIEGDDWLSAFSGQEKKFSSSKSALVIERDGGPAGRILRDLVLAGEYELRGKLRREGDFNLSTSHGWVIAGGEERNWIILSVDYKGENLLIKTLVPDGGGVREDVSRTKTRIEPPLANGETVAYRIHCYPEGRLVVYLGEREPVEIELDSELPKKARVGIYVKDGRTTLEQPVVEQFP